jgi:hypothetical protein
MKEIIFLARVEKDRKKLIDQTVLIAFEKDVTN